MIAGIFPHNLDSVVQRCFRITLGLQSPYEETDNHDSNDKD